MSKKLTLGSLFDGSGGFPLAGLLSGITPVWASEIEPFPIKVTTKRLPFMKHYGDISAMNGAEIEPVDIITFGSPCQDMSVAGKRAGLDGSRSNLFYEAVRIIKEMRCATNGEYPRYIVWENVPGAFSSNKGDDFRCVLESVCQIKDKTAVIPQPDKWQPAGEIVGDDYSVAWRVMDAQYWGVPQRRKRIFLVADFAGRSAGKILFDSEGLSGYSASSLRAWQETACRSGESPDSPSICLNDQGGSRIDVTEEVTNTLRAEAHHPPCVMDNKETTGALRTETYSAGFCTEHSAKARSIGYEEEKSPTLRAGTVPAAVYENHRQDTRYTGPVDVSPTVSSTYGMGGNNQPFVVETPKTLKIRSGCDGGGKGALIQEDKSATLSCNNDQTLFEPKVYGICSKHSNSMNSGNPSSGFYEAETARTIDTGNQSPCKNQGGMVVVAVQGSMIGRADKNGPKGSGVNEDVSFTLDSCDRHAVAYGIDRAAYNQGTNAKFNIAVEPELEPTIVAKGPGAVGQPIYHSSKNSFQTNFTSDEATDTLVATDYKDPPVVGTEYIVRRLTPTECARLQGFPDWWCADLGTENPTEEDIAFWRGVFETHRKIMGTSTKPKTDNQLIKWIKNPHSDSAEYKMWGNGINLNIAVFVLSGIVYYDSRGESDEL